MQGQQNIFFLSPLPLDTHILCVEWRTWLRTSFGNCANLGPHSQPGSSVTHLACPPPKLRLLVYKTGAVMPTAQAWGFREIMYVKNLAQLLASGRCLITVHFHSPYPALRNHNLPYLLIEHILYVCLPSSIISLRKLRPCCSLRCLTRST